MIEPNQVSCVIPYAGAEKYLPEVAGSALAQQFAEIIIVNDGCAPGQLSAVATLPGVRIIHLPKSVGCPNARNVGLKACATPYVVLLDHDDLLCGGYFKAISAWVTENRLRCAAATLRYIGESSKRVGTVVSRSPDFILPSGFFSEISLIKEIGYFLDTCCDDLFFFRSIRQATPLTTCPDAGVLYRIHPQATSSLNTRAMWAFDRLVPYYDDGSLSLAELNAIAREFASSGTIPAGLEARMLPDQTFTARYLSRSAYACWLNRDPIGMLKYASRLVGHLPILFRLARRKWMKS